MKDPHNRDDLESRLRRDPRREPSDPPPATEPEHSPPKIEILDSSKPPPADTSAIAAVHDAEPAQHSPPGPAARPAPSPPQDQPRHRPEGGASIVTSSDLRIPDLEKALASGNYDETLRLLGPAADSGRLPPNLGVLFAIAMKEKDRQDVPAGELNDLAIRCTAGLLGVSHDSPIALLIAKRLLRRNPVALHRRPAPRPTISILIITASLIVTGTLSWLISFGYLKFSFHLPW